MLKKILSVMLIVSVALMAMGCNGSTPKPDEGNDNPPVVEPEYEIWNANDYTHAYYAEVETATSGRQIYVLDFRGVWSRNAAIIEKDLATGKTYIAETADAHIGFQKVNDYGIMNMEADELPEIDAIFISQPFNGRAIKAGITKARGTDTWTIFQGDATNEIYLNDHEWTEEEKEALMTPDELIVLAETFVMRLESMFPGYMRLQPAEGGFTADLTYTDDVSGAPSSFMTGVKDYKWTELASWENRFQFMYEL